MDILANLYTHCGKRGGGGVCNPSLEFSLSCDLQDEVNIMGYALLGVHDVIQNGCQYGRHLGFYEKFKFIGKTRKLQIFFAAFGCVFW